MEYENQERGADKPARGAGTKHRLEIPNAEYRLSPANRQDISAFFNQEAIGNTAIQREYNSPEPQ